MIRSLLVWAFTWIYMVLATAVALPWLLVTRRLGLAYALARGGVRALLWLAGVRVRVEGGERLSGAGPRLYMANHQSNLDPPILLAYLPGEIAFLAKKELFAVPVLGAVLRMGRLVPVDRGNREAARASVSQAARDLKAGRPYLVFPEGTRSPDDRLLPFKKGPFYLAEESGVEVVPVGIRGTGRLMPRGTWRIRPGRVTLTIGAPVGWQECATAPEPRVECAARVRQALQIP